MIHWQRKQRSEEGRQEKEMTQAVVEGLGKDTFRGNERVVEAESE